MDHLQSQVLFLGLSLSLSLCIIFFVHLLTYVINSICEVCEYVSTPKFFRFLILFVRCAYDQQGFLLNALAATDGILGLSRAKVSLPSQLASQGIINNVIGHCLTTDAGGGGYMFLGDGFVHYRQMAWVPLLNSPST